MRFKKKCSHPFRNLQAYTFGPSRQRKRKKEREKTEKYENIEKGNRIFGCECYFDPVGKHKALLYDIIIIRLWIVSIVKWIQLTVIVFNDGVW